MLVLVRVLLLRQVLLPLRVLLLLVQLLLHRQQQTALRLLLPLPLVALSLTTISTTTPSAGSAVSDQLSTSDPWSSESNEPSNPVNKPSTPVKGSFLRSHALDHISQSESEDMALSAKQEMEKFTGKPTWLR